MTAGVQTATVKFKITYASDTSTWTFAVVEGSYSPAGIHVEPAKLDNSSGENASGSVSVTAVSTLRAAA